MKTKLFGLACILFVLMLFACDGSDGSDNATAGNNASATQGVVTLSFAVESDDAGEKAISINNPDFSSNLLYQYKAVAEFKLADGSDPVGSTGDEWNEIKEEMSFSTGKWTFDVRVIQKGNNYESDKSDFFIHYQTEAPLKITIDNTTAKFITFTVKKIIAGTGLIHINIGVTNQKDGKMKVNLYEIPKGGAPAISEPIDSKYNDKEKKLYFINDRKVSSGFYRMTIVYDDGNEEYKYYPGLIEVLDKQETFVEGDIEIDVKPMVVPFYVTNGKKELKGEVSANKIVFDSVEEYKKERLLLKIDGKIGNLLETKKIIINDALKKIDLNAVKKVDVQDVKKVDDQAKKKIVEQKVKIDQKEIQQIVAVKETIKYTFYCDGTPYDRVKIPEEGVFDVVELEPGKYRIGVKATAKLSDGSVLEVKIDPEFTVEIKK